MQLHHRIIIKNSLMLYFRMILIMGVTLYTSRVVLEVLGVENYGIYTLVGGIVAMFGFLNNSMALTTQRFLNFEMGRNNVEKINQVFSLSVSIHIGIAVLIFVLAETIGLWFLTTKLNIPVDRLSAAKWIYHFSVLSAMITVIQVPYNSVIIAYERMSVYAYVSIIDVILKLAIVFLLSYIGFDKLKLYAVLVFIVTLCVAFVYRIYCQRSFSICKYRPFWNKELFFDLLNQSSWNLLGTSAIMLSNQGGKMLLNIFFGVALNAASGLASQVNSALTQFVTNFLTAMRPQIVKMYAAGNLKGMYDLIYKGATFSFYLMLYLSLPILFQTETILSLWLKEVPDFTVVFTRLVLIDGMINTVTISFRTAIQATGKVKLYQILVSILLFLILPFSYLMFYLGFPPSSIYIVTIVVSLLTLCVRIAILNKIIFLPINIFFKEVFIKILSVLILSIIILYFSNQLIQCNSLNKLLLMSFISTLSISLSLYIFGLSQSIKKQLKEEVRRIIRNIYKK